MNFHNGLYPFLKNNFCCLTFIWKADTPLNTPFTRQVSLCNAFFLPPQHKAPTLLAALIFTLLYARSLRAAREGTSSPSSRLRESFSIGCQWHHRVLDGSSNDSQPQRHAARPSPSHQRAGPHCTRGKNLILMMKPIGSLSRQSRYVTSVGWQTSFNIISGAEQGKSTTKKCCRSTALGRTEWRQRCQRAEIINPSSVHRDTHW